MHSFFFFNEAFQVDLIYCSSLVAANLFFVTYDLNSFLLIFSWMCSCFCFTGWHTCAQVVFSLILTFYTVKVYMWCSTCSASAFPLFSRWCCLCSEFLMWEIFAFFPGLKVRETEQHARKWLWQHVQWLRGGWLGVRTPPREAFGAIAGEVCSDCCHPPPPPLDWAGEAGWGAAVGWGKAAPSRSWTIPRRSLTPHCPARRTSSARPSRSPRTSRSCCEPLRRTNTTGRCLQENRQHFSCSLFCRNLEPAQLFAFSLLSYLHSPPSSTLTAPSRCSRPHRSPSPCPSSRPCEREGVRRLRHSLGCFSTLVPWAEKAPTPLHPLSLRPPDPSSWYSGLCPCLPGTVFSSSPSPTLGLTRVSPVRPANERSVPLTLSLTPFLSPSSFPPQELI